MPRYDYHIFYELSKLPYLIVSALFIVSKEIKIWSEHKHPITTLSCDFIKYVLVTHLLYKIVCRFIRES